MESNNPFIRFLNEQTTETLRKIKEAALENQKSIDALKKTCWEAQEKLNSILKEL